MEILPTTDGFQVQVDEQYHQLRVLERDQGHLLFELDGRQQRIHWAREGRRIWLHLDGHSYELEKSAGTSAAGAALQSGESILRAPMPGQVRELMVSAGDQVELGELLMMLEAMKMEIRIQAPRAGVVARVSVAAGASVEKDQILVELQRDENQEDD